MYIGKGERAMLPEAERLYLITDVPLPIDALRAGGLRIDPPGETAVGSSKSHVTPCLVQFPQAG